MKLNEFLDNKLDSETYDLFIVDSDGKMIEESIDYEAEVIHVVYKKIGNIMLLVRLMKKNLTLKEISI